MKPYLDKQGFYRAPISGSRAFRTRSAAQEYCDFMVPPNGRDWRDELVVWGGLTAFVVMLAVLWPA